MSEIKFITEEQREELRRAYAIVENVKRNVTIEYEEFFVINSTLDLIMRAIDFKRDYY